MKNLYSPSTPTPSDTCLQLHVGIDDTDSPRGGCTTYIAAILVERLLNMGASFIDYPILLRLNPNAPWKTRGNGAVCLRFEAPDENLDRIKSVVISLIEDQAEFDCDNTNPGVVFHVGRVPQQITEFSESVVQTIVSLDEAERIVNTFCASAVGWKNKRGLIGALAAVGGLLIGDYTYELLTYRILGQRGLKRMVDPDSVRSMNVLCPDTFNSVDPDTGKILITPRGPDPVLYGVRGETPEAVLGASRLIKILEPMERWVIFRTNQGTDAHLSRSYKITDLKPRFPAVVTGTVRGNPRTIEGGHVILMIGDDSGVVDCAAYEPSGNFRKVVQSLVIGDEVRVAGGVREVGTKPTLNLERLEVLRTINDLRLVNPRCPKCGAGTESMGRQQGLRCKMCGYRDSSMKKTAISVVRSIKPGLYLPPLRSERHLTKPLRRYGKERENIPSSLFEPWCSYRL